MAKLVLLYQDIPSKQQDRVRIWVPASANSFDIEMILNFWRKYVGLNQALRYNTPQFSSSQYSTTQHGTLQSNKSS